MVSKIINPLSDRRYTISGGSLIINNPKEETERGLYFCKATNPFGSIVSETVQLNFGFIGEFNLNRQKETGLQNWGKALNCDPPHFYPGEWEQGWSSVCSVENRVINIANAIAEVKYAWSRPRFPDFVEEDKRVFVSHDGALYFSALEPIDEGNYSCNVHNGDNSGTSMGRNGPEFALVVNPSCKSCY